MRQQKKFIIPIPYELLYHLYVTKHISTSTIAKQLHCSQSTICQRLRDYEIPFHNRTPCIPKEELIALYTMVHPSTPSPSTFMCPLEPSIAVYMNGT